MKNKKKLSVLQMQYQYNLARHIINKNRLIGKLRVKIKK